MEKMFKSLKRNKASGLDVNDTTSALNSLKQSESIYIKINHSTLGVLVYLLKLFKTADHNVILIKLSF